MKKVIINENQRGFLFKDGKFIKMLMPGKYSECFGKNIEISDIDGRVCPSGCSIDVILRDEKASESVCTAEVPDNFVALHFINGNFDSVLPGGKYAFWTVGKKHEFKMIDISDPEVSSDIPEYILSRIPSEYCEKIEVSQYRKARLYYNKKLIKLLDPGTYYFWKNGTKIDVGFVDTRLTGMNITGQEILTLDKISIRINLALNYRVKDYVKILTEIDDFSEQLHVCAQLALREYVGRYKLDEILENKEKMSEFIFKKLKEKEDEFFVEITDAGVKDIILPGDMREIMNTVILAEKRAQANVITRREEVASTRSLLNTARLMDENKTLYKLKELEYIERICENVGNIDLSSNSNSDILAQLSKILTSNS